MRCDFCKTTTLESCAPGTAGESPRVVPRLHSLHGGGCGASGGASLALGVSAVAGHEEATALGTTAQTTNINQIQLGRGAVSGLEATRAIIGAPNSAIADADLVAGQISFYLDEGGNTLTVKAKYSSGTVKTGTVALV